MLRLSFGFVLGYHGCDHAVAEDLLAGKPFKASENDYDWLGGGVYFWEANPIRGLEYAEESMSRKNSKIKNPAVVGAVIDLGVCLDLTTSFGIEVVKRGYLSLKKMYDDAGTSLPTNSKDLLRRKLDCAVIERIHTIFDDGGLAGC